MIDLETKVTEYEVVIHRPVLHTSKLDECHPEDVTRGPREEYLGKLENFIRALSNNVECVMLFFKFDHPTVGKTFLPPLGISPPVLVSRRTFL